jgi:hypothetical protein
LKLEEILRKQDEKLGRYRSVLSAIYDQAWNFKYIVAASVGLNLLALWMMMPSQPEQKMIPIDLEPNKSHLMINLINGRVQFCELKKKGGSPNCDRPKVWK